MSGSDDDWFDKEIDDFVVKTKIAENVEDISSAKKDAEKDADLASSTADPFSGYGGNYALPGQSDGKGGNGSYTKSYIQPMSFKKLGIIVDLDPLNAFLEVIYPESGFFEALDRKTNPQEAIIGISNVICKIVQLPFHENIRLLCEEIVDVNNFWSQFERYLRDSTAPPVKSKSKKKAQLPKNDIELWQCVTQLCQAVDGHKVQLKKSFVKKIVQLGENNLNPEMNVEPYLETLKKIQDDQLDELKQLNVCSIFPSLDELKSTNEEALNPNIIKGRYRDVAHYLDVHLSLLKEDLVSPLRDGIQQIISKSTEDEAIQSNSNVNVYSPVKIMIKEKDNASKTGVIACIMVDLEPNVRGNKNELGKYAHSRYAKKLMYGSLLCLTTTSQFDDLIVAIVSNRDIELLNKGYIQIEIVKTYNITSFFEKEFIMCESDVYFESYRHVYEVLKNFNEQTFPLRNYIIDVDTTHAYPAYIPSDGKTVFVYKKQPLEIRNASTWPTAEALQLNDSQLNAFKSSLTRKFSVIQGPPGTGKTFIGLEIISTLLKNTDAQILIVCFTNHALDQFLTGVMQHTHNIIRIGNQSKNDMLDQFNLKALNDNVVNDKLLKGSLYKLKLDYTTSIQQFTQLQLKMMDKPIDEALMKQYLIIQANLQSISRRQEELKQIGHYNLIKSKRVIGMTSTGAARCHSLIQLLQTPIVFIEEAAEILEPHIVASLTTSVQHLILTGDHQQLRPTSSVYKLAQLYKMDISLFERMINNDINCATLNQQYRMRPEIANLIRPTIYKTLLDSESVKQYPSVLGMEKNLFFFDHKNPESVDGDETTKKNKFESKFLLSLCNYLILQGYKPEDITILATYNGQMFQLIADRKNYHNLKRVRITVVDNYQGEDSKIILLSLVRSNTKNSIGYLGFKNRVCVALSRAKEGQFIVGNMDLLAKNSKTWAAIQAELQQQNAIGEALGLLCATHGNITNVQNSNDIDALKGGGCQMICDESLPCGHTCQKNCHAQSIKHAGCDCNRN